MHQRNGMSLTELMAVLAVTGIVVLMILPRVTGESNASNKAACHSYQGYIEIQVELWRHQTGTWPATNLSDIGGDTSYFPDGLPTCPVDGSAYTIDSQGRVVGHDH